METAAAKASPFAIKQLEGPEFPEALRYLWDRFQLLSGMRGTGLNGPARLTVSDFVGADALFQWGLRPYEVEALVLLDIATLYPGEDEE